MSGVRTVVLVGNPRPASRTATAAVQAAHAALHAAGIAGTSAAEGAPAAANGNAGQPRVVDLAGLAPYLFGTPVPDAVRGAVDTVLDADVLVVASPTYKGTYTGLLKAFCDLVPTGALAGTVALPVLVMGAPAHALAVDAHLRPLLVELGAQVPTPGLALTEADLARPDAVLAAWAGRVAPVVRHLTANRPLRPSASDTPSR